jgi:hypothetical protein
MKKILVLAGLLLALPVAALELQWDYPTDHSKLVFEVWGSCDLVEWEHDGDTADLSWPIDTAAPMRFFKVRARDTETGLVSEWSSN